MSTVMPFRRKKAAVSPAERTGIIDIGSNSIRLVVFDGPARFPAVLFNEKVMAGLGRGLGEGGMLDQQAIDRAIGALTRFRHLIEEMEVARVRTVATAAVRDAANGRAFLDEVAALGFSPELLSGEEEAKLSAEGVLSGIPDAEGIVGDLGGGSLELVRVGGGRVLEGISFPLGVFRTAALRAKGPGALDRHVDKLLDKSGWAGRGAELPFYMVGGSWRSLARLDMHLSDYALPIVHGYQMPAEEAQRLVRVLAHIAPKSLRAVEGLSASRIPALADAAVLLAALVKHLGSSALVVSAYGLREGLLYDDLSEDVRALDPLICAAREEGQLRGRFPEHGDLLDRWIAPLFRDESPTDTRLRFATCLLADIGWRAHPEFRAERGLDAGLHGNWPAIDARGRAMIAHALYVNFGGTGRDPVISRLCQSEDIARAERWGLALRLGQRLSGGIGRPLEATRLWVDEATLKLAIPSDDAALYGEIVERRLKTLGQAMGCAAELVLGD
jgi:exopolyphosphatase / guanosine-5'-triphosphate,3'-diphosphate pyrophosphatase